jgi:AcrR family transcriptional regulator
MQQQQRTRRSGGGTARVSAAAHRAILDLLRDHDWNELSIPLVAQRSGVNQATIYRRWGTLPALIVDALAEELAHSAPAPDTGSLRGDLDQYAVQAAESLAGPQGNVFLRAAMLTARTHQERVQQFVMNKRGEQLHGMLDRAASRGETPPTLEELLEVVLAPLYFHALFLRPADVDHARMLVDRLLTLVQQRSAG